ncbi:MAG: minor capsid protein, partial [Fibrobacter sp.]|nr:minor capsid protein [Fibrobacter sp.]
KKKGKRPKVSPHKFYPSKEEAEANEALLEELKDYSFKLERAASSGSVDDVYAVPGATPESFAEKAYDIALKVSRFNVRAFADFSDLVVGERFFPSQDNRQLIIDTWTTNFVDLCKSTNEEMRKKVAGVISDGVLSGRNLREMLKEIQNSCDDFSRNKAELIATTEVGKLNSAIAKNQSESAGIEYYEWSAAMDGRTRESHALMDGRICKWGDETHYYEWVDKKDGTRKLERRERPKGAYKGAPGTDFRCRCVALPYVKEYEDDYKETREDKPVHGVTQGANADPTTIKIKESLANEVKKNEIKMARKLREKKRKEIAKQRADIENKKAIVKKRRAQTLNLFKKLFKEEQDPEEKKPNLFVSKKREEESKKGNKIKDFKKELEIGEIMGKNGHPVCLIPETNFSDGVKHSDSIMDGLETEFKEVVGSRNKVGHRFLEAFHQAGTNVIHVKSKSITNVADFVNKIFGSAKKSYMDNHEINYSSPYSWVIINGGKPKRINVGEIIERARKYKK